MKLLRYVIISLTILAPSILFFGYYFGQGWLEGAHSWQGLGEGLVIVPVFNIAWALGIGLAILLFRVLRRFFISNHQTSLNDIP